MGEHSNICFKKEQQFEKTAIKILHNNGFLSTPIKATHPEQGSPKHLMRKGSYTYCVEIKYSRTRTFSKTSAVSIAANLEHYKMNKEWVLLVVVGGEVSLSLDAEFLAINQRTVIVDIKNLLHMAWSDRELYDELVAQLPYSLGDLRPAIPDLLPMPDWNAAYENNENWRVSTIANYETDPNHIVSSGKNTRADLQLFAGGDGAHTNTDSWDNNGNIISIPDTITMDFGSSCIDISDSTEHINLQDSSFPPIPHIGTEHVDSLLHLLERHKNSDSSELKNELHQWKGSKGTSQSLLYEKLCTKVLKRLFSDDLSLWQTQAQSNGRLYRFDMVCKITRDNHKDFWEMAERHFHSKYIVFEFKNYSKKVTQMEITTTGRYLYEKALRGIAIIISPNGTNNNADKAIRGMLREEGKLILSLTNEELIEMLRMQDNGDDPADYLSEKLDALLIDLEK